jgi:hypothetical protein
MLLQEVLCFNHLATRFCSLAVRYTLWRRRRHSWAFSSFSARFGSPIVRATKVIYQGVPEPVNAAAAVGHLRCTTTSFASRHSSVAAIALNPGNAP